MLFLTVALKPHLSTNLFAIASSWSLSNAMGARSSCKDSDEKRTPVLRESLTVAVGSADNVGGGGGSVVTIISVLTVSGLTEVGQAVTKTLALGGATGGDWSLIWDQLAGGWGPPYCT